MAENDENNDALQNQSAETHAEETIAHSLKNTAVDEDADPEEILVEDLEIEIGGIRFGGNAYQDTYRNGNFGVKRGRLNFTRAKICSFAHFFMACTITLLSTGCIVLLTDNNFYWIYTGAVDGFLFLSPIGGFFGLLTSCSGMYLSFSHAKLQRPLIVLLVVRLLALLECLLIFSAFICAIIVTSEAKSVDDTWPECSGNGLYSRNKNKTLAYCIAKNKPLFTGLCSGLAVSMAVDWIIAVAWLFHWWRCCACCQCFKSCCIFQPGEPLAPGVPNPPTGFFSEFVYVIIIAIRSCIRSNWSLI